MPVVLLIVVVAWFIFGNPQKQLAEWFFKDGPAPWEKVDAFYYPDSSDLSTWRVGRDLGSLEACRDYVYGEAALFNDPDLVRGDFECAVGKSGTFGDIGVYRLTVQ